MTPTDMEILLAAQQEASGVLADANARARRAMTEAEKEALAVVFQQQAIAEELLRHEEDEVARRALTEEEASRLLERNRAAAEALAGTQAAAAVDRDEAAEDTAAGILLAGHREAAAILLKAWMQVTEARPLRGAATPD